jgi:hypothetical protein
LYFVEEKTYPVVKVEDFIQHVKTLHADTDDKFSQEFSVSHLHANKASVGYTCINALSITQLIMLVSLP